MNGAGPLLRLEGVYKRYGEVEVLRGVDLDVAVSNVICLIGGSGCGKSTLLKCANLIEPVQAGRILLEGEEISSENADPDRVRRHIGMVFQAYNLFPHMSVMANVTLAPRRVLDLPQREADERGRELLSRFGLADKGDEYPDRLSGGQQQRAAIVRALAMEPRILLLDEVTSALDPELIGEVLTVIRELAESGMTMVLATHEMGFARQIADRICFMSEGVILEQGPPEQMFGSPREERTQAFLKRIVEAGRAADLAAGT
jgi:polar amino acid transport system ATP-binding protein